MPLPDHLQTHAPQINHHCHIESSTASMLHITFTHMRCFNWSPTSSPYMQSSLAIRPDQACSCGCHRHCAPPYAVHTWYWVHHTEKQHTKIPTNCKTVTAGLHSQLPTFNLAYRFQSLLSHISQANCQGWQFPCTQHKLPDGDLCNCRHWTSFAPSSPRPIFQAWRSPLRKN